MLKIKFRRPSVKLTFRPHRVWRWLISVFLLLAAGALAGGYYLYRQLETIELISQRRLESNPVEPLRLDLKTLARVRERLDVKAARTEALKLNPPAVADPSL